MIYLLSETVIPKEAYGIWDCKEISQSLAEWYASKTFTSAVGHESTAEIMSTILRVTVPVNRISIIPQPSDQLLCFKLNQRVLKEGVILSKEQIKELGYHWVLMTYHGTIGQAIDAKLNYIEGYCDSLNQRV